MSAGTRRAATDGRPVIAYLMSRFPKLTETFILYELLAVESLGVRVEIFPLLRARATANHPEGRALWRKVLERVLPSRGPLLMHPEARALVSRAHYAPFISPAIAAANWRALRRNPRRYLRALAVLVERNLGSANFLVGGLAIFPKAVYFAERMRELGVQHVHAHFANHPAAAGWVIGQVSGLPWSFTAHGADLQVDQHMLCRKVRDARAVITISEHNRDFIAGHCGEGARARTRVVRAGVDTALLAPAEALPDAGRHAGRRPFELLCIGTFYEVKGHRYLIEACRLMVDRSRQVVCRLIGEGPDRASLEAAVRDADLGDVVRFEGPLPREDVIAALRRADALVLPSIPTTSGRREGIPVVLMEAMACGVPVIASGISGIPELVADGESGLLVPPRDPAAIADAVDRLAGDPTLRQRLAAGGRARVTAEFDLHLNARRLLDAVGIA